MILFSFVCLLTIFIDQLVKYFVEVNLLGKSIKVIDNILNFSYVQNTGAAWGIFSENSWILLISVPIFIILIGIYVYKTHKGRIELALGAIIVGGAIGNYIDRLFRGYVVDYIDFHIWPVFNFADICIVLGCILFIISVFRKEKQYGN